MVPWSLKVALGSAFVFVALIFILRMSFVFLARFKGSAGIDASRPAWFIFYLGMWVVSFVIVYSIFPAFARK